MNVEIVITWYNGKPISFWYNDELVWETSKIVTDTKLLKTVVVLPLLESIRYINMLINGLTTDYLLIIHGSIQKKIEELNEVKNENQKINYDIDINEDW